MIFFLGRGYYPEAYKIVLILHPDNIESEKRFGIPHMFKVCMGARYLGGFIEDENPNCDFLKDITQK